MIRTLPTQSEIEGVGRSIQRPFSTWKRDIDIEFGGLYVGTSVLSRMLISELFGPCFGRWRECYKLNGILTREVGVINDAIREQSCDLLLCCIPRFCRAS